METINDSDVLHLYWLPSAGKFVAYMKAGAKMWVTYQEAPARWRDAADSLSNACYLIRDGWGTQDYRLMKRYYYEGDEVGIPTPYVEATNDWDAVEMIRADWGKKFEHRITEVYVVSPRYRNVWINPLMNRIVNRGLLTGETTETIVPTPMESP
jgi:hypothetical protein